MAQPTISSFFKRQTGGILKAAQSVAPTTPVAQTPLGISKKRNRSSTSDGSVDDVLNKNTENQSKENVKQARTTISPEVRKQIEKRKMEALAKQQRSHIGMTFGENVDSQNFLLSDFMTEPGWNAALQGEMSKPYFQKLEQFVKSEYRSKKIFPPVKDVFRAFDLCALDDIKVVILGQDPYHGPGQAHGLSFSVQKGIQVPPSLRNIYKEAASDVGITKPTHGDLTSWASQGVLLLNTVLTVRQSQAHSHKNKGWEQFTDAVIKVLNKQENVVFLLWGRPSQTKIPMLNPNRHLIISSSHPSPLGATKTNKPFIGSRCFSKANEYLKKHGKEPIDWQIR